MDEYQKIIEEAMALGLERHPHAPSENHTAYAHAVAYAMTGIGLGLTLREQVAKQLIYGRFGSRPCSFKKATALLEECCYGLITEMHLNMLLFSDCSDATEEEQAQVSALLAY